MSDQNSHFKPDFDISEFQQADFSQDADLNHKSSESDSMILSSDDIAESLIPLQQISLEAVIKSLIEKGVFSHKEISDCENACRKITVGRESFEIKPSPQHVENTEPHFVRTHSRREKKRVKHRYLHKALSKHKWSRRIGTLLFGWKWHRKGTNDGDGILVG